MTFSKSSSLALPKLDEDLKKFYEKHNVELSSLFQTRQDANGSTVEKDPFVYRFVRLNPRFNTEETLRDLKSELGGRDPIPVNWLPGEGFFALPSSFGLSTSPSFQSGKVYGMDVSSGAGVATLLSSRYDKSKPSTNESITTSSKEVRVLDLCCCPGLKLCALADHFPQESTNTQATIVGVDISSNRMALCKKIVQKYHIDARTSGTSPDKHIGVKIQLFCQDGTTFGTEDSPQSSSNNPSLPAPTAPQSPLSTGLTMNLVFDSRVSREEEATRGSRKRKNKSARARERKRLKELGEQELSLSRKAPQIPSNLPDTSEQQDSQEDLVHGPLVHFPLFDYVLVDAECSTDGSLKHMRERLKEAIAKPTNGCSTNQQESNLLLTDQNQLTQLVDLQRRLLASGFRLLKVGGTLVYSTCSLAEEQNEGVVRWLLEQHKGANGNSVELVPLEFAGVSQHSKLVVEGSLPGTIRFYPNIGGNENDLFGDGFFLAKLKKIK